jgi:outer membrane protein OmpA-like peptidoglycan-associated protein
VTVGRCLGAGAAALALLGGCVQAPVLKPPPETSYPTIRQASRNAALPLADQLKQSGRGHASVWISPAINLHSGEVTLSGRELQVMLALDLKTSLGDVLVKSFGADQDAKWDWVLAPTVVFERPTEAKADESWFRVEVGVVGRDGNTLPGLVMRVNGRQFDATPSRFFQDAPMFLTGTYHDKRLEFAKGGKSALSLAERNRFMANEGLLQEAILAYEERDFAAAVAGFEKVIAADPDNLAALSGRYQTQLATGNQAGADAALGRLMEVAVRNGNVSLRLLFQVRSVELRDDLDVTARYQGWLKELARQVAASGKCLTVQGHASRSGKAEFNIQLSQARAGNVMNHLLRYYPGLKGKIRAEGRGFQDNIVGSGTDDAKDAIDRRVDFRISDCK